MRATAWLLGGALAAAAPLAFAQSNLTLPEKIEAGQAFSIPTNGSGNATLYIAGQEQVLKRAVQLGQPVEIATGALYDAGEYLVVLSANGSVQSGTLTVTPSKSPADISFLARPSRLPVGLNSGITGAVYLFDAYHNLITEPTPVSFNLSLPNGATQTRTVTSRDGAAWTSMDSSPQQGADKFVARAGQVAETRVIGQVPGDPCSLSMSAKPNGKVLELETAPVRDCSGNAVPDGTIVTFTEAYNGQQSTVDVPLKRGIAKVEMPAEHGALITVASGVVLGNQIRWER